MPPDSWHPSSPRSAPHQFNNFGSDNPMAPKESTVTSTTDTVCGSNQSFYDSSILFASICLPLILQYHRPLFDLRCSAEMALCQAKQLCQVRHIW